MKWHGKLSVHTHLKNVLVQNEKSHKDTSFKFLLTPLPPTSTIFHEININVFCF